MMTRSPVSYGDELNGAVKMSINRSQTAGMEFGIVGMRPQNQQTRVVVHDQTNFVMPGRAISTVGASPHA